MTATVVWALMLTFLNDPQAVQTLYKIYASEPGCRAKAADLNKGSIPILSDYYICKVYVVYP